MSGIGTFAEIKEWKRTPEFLDNLNQFPWTLDQALSMIRESQEEAHKCGYHLNLSGGVLNNGISYNDLDLVVMYGSHETYLMKDHLINHFCNKYSLNHHSTKEFPGIEVVKCTEIFEPHRDVDLIFVKK